MSLKDVMYSSFSVSLSFFRYFILIITNCKLHYLFYVFIESFQNVSKGKSVKGGGRGKNRSCCAMSHRNTADSTFQGSRTRYLQCDFTQYHIVSFMIEDTLIFSTE